MDELRVRVYNVRFGDAILVSVPDRGRTGRTRLRHILIDIGNALGTQGGLDALFRPVVENILEVLEGQPLDLYIMTHEHMDHVQGPLYANKNCLPDHDLVQRLRVRHAWLTASSAPDYYETHSEARRKLDEARSAYKEIEQFMAISPAARLPYQGLLDINNPQSTKDCVDLIRSLARKTWYVHSRTDLTGKHPFQEAKLELWAPEEDTSIYYGAFYPLNLGLTAGPGGTPVLATPLPPPGVDAGAFYNLVTIRRTGYAENLLAIDKAANNTSLVLCLEWRGWRLLFPGDAEVRSWQEMDKRGRLKPVHLFKVSHHGSRTGLPPAEILGKVLPIEPADGRPRSAVVSTFVGTYPGVPDPDVLGEIEERCSIKDTRTLPDGGFFDVTFAG